MNKKICIANEKAGIAIDVDSAGLVSLTNRQSGDDYLKKRAMKPSVIFQLSGCISGNTRMVTLVPDGNARVSRNNTGKKKRIAITYNSVSGGGRNYRLTCCCAITLNSNTEESIWELTIANHERELAVHMVSFPRIYGIMLGAQYQDNILFYPYNAGQRIANPVENLPRKETFTFWPAVKGRGSWARELEYSGQCSMAWLELSNGEEGLYLGSYDETFTLTGIRVETGGTAHPWMGLAMKKYVLIPPGKIWKSGRFGVGVHLGSWHWGARTYRKWARQALKKPGIPAWFRENPSMITHYDFGPARKKHHRFKDIPRLFEQARSIGVEHLKIASYNRGGFDTWYPEFTPDMRLGTSCDLAEGIGHVTRQGGHFMFYINSKIFNQQSIFFDSLGRQWMCQDINGKPQNELYNNYTFATMCTGSGWRKYIIDLARWLMTAYGATGIYFDEFSHGYGRVCYASDHEHHHHGEFNQSSVKLIGEAVAAMRKITKDSVSMSEGCSDIYGQYLSVHLALEADCRPENRFPQMFKYTFPDYILIREIQNETQLYQAFLLGSGFWLHDGNLNDRKLRAKIAKAIQLRRELKEYVAYGRYNDTEMAEVTDPSIEYSGFAGKHGSLMVFFNPRKLGSAWCHVQTSDRFGECREMDLRLKPRTKPVSYERNRCSFRISPLEFSVVLLVR